MRIASLRLDHAASTRSAESLLLQYDNVTRQLGASLRSRWTLAPGRELLAALDRLSEGGRSLQTRATVKPVWAFED